MTDTRRRARFAFLILAFLAALLAVWAALTGGFRFHVFGIPISVRGEHRAAFFAVLFAAGAWMLLEPEQRRLWIGRGTELIRLGRFRLLSAQWLWIVPLAAAAMMLAAGLTFATRSA